ncbi:carboxylesterase/lipase family protein [Amycolatopsis sp. ATCC 39116]|uniref:carboxylesterase/lipase family protein n=1 Tax=Amycolatopsis sp. (strain ATCC 39116 / 75iv2) TaxID=385957 RepID=UPI000486280F|nr:carboxylesterase family protein [Amycolatopsis sp. ATCC 39116]
MVEVQVTGGTIRGITKDGVARFLGVPYAAPPFGAHRMKQPAAVPPWDGVRDATSCGPTAPKGEYPPQYQAIFPEPVIAGEECLNLNVWTPSHALSGGSLPVFVWVHGGSFTNGSNAVTAYDGSAFARDGVVCVTINYRLGAEGFLFTEADRGTGTANLGLQDQIAALRWVQANIRAFGGDPARVTVGGQSAGAMAVTTLLAMPSAAGLFARVIAQSGAAANTLDAETGLAVSRVLADRLGTEPDRAAIADAGLDAVVKAVSDLVTEIQTTRDVAKWGALALSTLPFAPVIDGALLPRHPLDAFESGAGRDVAVLTGSNRQEARLFLVAPGTIDEIDETALAEISAAYGLSPTGLDSYRRHFPDLAPGDLLAQVVTDWYYAVPAVRMAEARERGGGATWVYRFDRPRPEENHGLGAAHAVELPYVFDTTGRPELEPLIGPNPARAIAASTHSVWVRFITNGDPGWAAYSEETRTTALLAETVSVADDPDAELRRAWDGRR